VIWDLDGTLINLKIDWKGLMKARKYDDDWDTIERYELANVDQAKPIKRSVECVKELKNRGCKLAICSSNMKITVGEALDILGIYDYFDFIMSGDTVRNKKPDPEGLVKIVKILGIAKDKTVFIGNSWKDEAAGKRANIQTLLLKEIKSLR
jgi:HAD superfamily phosphatase (TIGR01681 family)